MSKDNRFFEVLADEAIMGILAFEQSSRTCVYINCLARETLELGESSTIPGAMLALEDLFPQDNRTMMARPLCEDMLKHEGLYQDILVRKKNGLLIIANVGVKHVLLDDGSKRLMLMFQDTTIQKKLQREVQVKQEEIHRAFTELLEQNRQLKELDQAKDRFIALTTHELRTPLAAIVATAEVLELKLYESEEQRDSFIKTIHEQGRHLTELVNDILDFAKIRAGKMDFYVEQIEISLLASKLVSNFDRIANQTSVTLEVLRPEIGDELIAWVDLLRFKEVVNNVVHNAIKYNKRGGKVSMSFSKLEGERVRITVTDTGVGIPAGKLQNVFNEFETLGNVSRHHKGTGLGMPISKRLMEAMGGEITLASVEGEGTSFYLDFPTGKVLAPELYRTRADADGDLAA